MYEENLTPDETQEEEKAPIVLPERIDWREIPGILTEIKQQGVCGSCWAFSTAAVVEGRYAYKNPDWEVESLSMQELIDCGDFDECNDGCDGGVPTCAFDYVIEQGGMVPLRNYKYKGKDGKCKEGLERVAPGVK